MIMPYCSFVLCLVGSGRAQLGWDVSQQDDYREADAEALVKLAAEAPEQVGRHCWRPLCEAGNDAQDLFLAG